MRPRAVLRWARIILGWLAAVVGSFFLAALIGALVPVNRHWREPAQGIDIFVETNGVHTGLILPMRAAGVDWSAWIRPEHISDPRRYGTHFQFGWGNRDVYLNVPTWGDLTPGVAARAMFGGGAGLVHVDHEQTPGENRWRRRIRVTPAQYRRIAADIRAAFRLGPNGRPSLVAGAHYGPADSFYDGVGGYSLFNSCNSWTGRTLAHAGVRVGLWTPFADGVMRWFPPREGSAR